MRVDSWFVCPECEEQTLHQLHYADDVLHEITCTRCGRARYGHHHPIGGYLHELQRRIATKPRRMYGEISTVPARVCTLPARIISKPARVVREFIEVLQ